MIVYKIKNLNDIETCRKVEKTIREFNKGKSLIWLPEYWVEAELIGDTDERKVVVYVKEHFKIPDVQDIYKFLEEKYNMMGGEEFLKNGDSAWIPYEMVRLEVLENKKSNVNVNYDASVPPITVFKVDCNGLSPSMAFALVDDLREHYSNVDTEVPNQCKDTDAPYTVKTEIWVPDPLVTVERI